MDKYTIYCTETQTKKALELGAPIEEFCGLCPTTSIDGILYDIPTAEQMVSWLEEQGLIVTVDKGLCSEWHAYVQRNREILYLENELPTRKEATIAAIDAALEYLTNNKK